MLDFMPWGIQDSSAEECPEMTVTRNHPRRRCPSCGKRKRIRVGQKVCYMCRKAEKKYEST